MASILKHLRSSTADKRPTASGLADGQIALNTASGTPAMFFKDSAGNIVKVGPAHIGTTAPNVSPAGSAGNSDGELWIDESLTTRGLKYYDGTAFINLTPSGTTSTVGLVELATDAETQAGTDNARVVTPSGLQSKISDSTSTTSSTTIASSTAVKSAFDLANAALPKTGGTLTGELLISPSGSLVFEGSSDDSFETTIAVTNPTADRTITFPNVTGNVVTTGDSGTITSTMILDDTIVNADINSAAAIAHSKLANITAGSVLLGNASNVPTATALSGDVTINSSGVTAISAGVIVNADINASAAIVDTKLDTIATADKVSLSALNIDGATDIGGALENGDLFVVDDGAGGTNRKAQAFRMAQLTYSGVTGDITVASGGTAAISAGVIVNADVNASAAIAGTKISPDFGSQNVTTTGTDTAASYSPTSSTAPTNGVYLPAANTVGISTGGSGRLFINSTGDIQVGAASTLNAAVLSATANPASKNLYLAFNGTTTGADFLMGGISANANGTNIGAVDIYRGSSDDHGYISFRTKNGTTLGERVRITATGLVGVGTSTARAGLTVALGSASIPAAGASTASAVFSNATDGGVYGVVVGANTSGLGYIQSQRTDGTATTYDLAIQPNGGRVGIGTNSPSFPLHVAGGRTLCQTGNEDYSIGIARSGTTNAYYLGVHSSTSPNLLFSNNAGTTRMVLTDGGSLGIGTASPQVFSGYTTLTIDNVTNGGVLCVNKNAVNIGNISATNDALTLDAAGGGSSPIVFRTGAATTERARIDSSGRLLVGTSSSIGNVWVGGASYQSPFQVIGNAAGYGNGLTSLNYSAGGYAATLTLGNSKNATVGVNGAVANGDDLGIINFVGNDGTNFRTGAYIIATADGATGTADLPTRLAFWTAPDGTAAPVERMRITSTGQAQFSYPTATDYGVSMDATNASYGGTVLGIDCNRAATDSYYFLNCSSGNGADNEFNLRGGGSGYCDGSWNGGGADYAEYFEWSDSNPDEEDRRGISVVLDGDKIREAVAGEDPIGVISGNPSVVGDAAWNKWSGKHLRDEFGTYIQEDYEVTDEDGNIVIQQRRKLNPAYDADQQYIPREQRPEWDCVGLMGKLRIRKGQVTGSRWIKMRDISDSVEEWLVR